MKNKYSKKQLEELYNCEIFKDTGFDSDLKFWVAQGLSFTEETADLRHSRRQSGGLFCRIRPAGEPVPALCRRLRERAPPGYPGGGGALVALPVRRRGA